MYTEKKKALYVCRFVFKQAIFSHCKFGQVGENLYPRLYNGLAQLVIKQHRCRYILALETHSQYIFSVIYFNLQNQLCAWMNVLWAYVLSNTLSYVRMYVTCVYTAVYMYKSLLSTVSFGTFASCFVGVCIMCVCIKCVMVVWSFCTCGCDVYKLCV